jgi:general secretion pathway protein J
MPPRPPVRAAGFTLVELLVAISLMAVMAVMSWRGIDAMSRAQTLTQQRGDEVLALQMGLAQWSADLDALEPVADLPGLDWDGRVLRLTRRGAADADGAVRVVAWTRRLVDGRSLWLRWESAPVRQHEALQTAWLQATLWAQNPDDAARRQEVAVMPLDDWQLFYFRQDAWTNPLSSADGSPAAGAAASLRGTTPEGVRLVLRLPAGAALSGLLTRDWVRPTLGGNKS